jgi:hypothetical protein
MAPDPKIDAGYEGAPSPQWVKDRFGWEMLSIRIFTRAACKSDRR